ncbi:hypothetical protein HAX54_018442 [Datura stramonium]|uniref:BRCT domain-containing protein n=1 Tax=Datura stramonium TaxID=4076 RepID=A0ABS8UM95_DATST|nr:hypothetical protein [Datura stramonium]
MHEILEANSQYSSGDDDAVVPRCQDIMFFGPLDNCPICGGKLECSGDSYLCVGDYKGEWSSCVYSTMEPPRREVPQTPKSLLKVAKSFCAQQYWKSKIEKYGGKVNNSVTGGTSSFSSYKPEDRGGSSKVAEAVEKGIPVVRKAWLVSVKGTKPVLDAYDIASDIAVEGKLKVFWKEVHKDTLECRMQKQIIGEDGLLYNCALSVCNQERTQ